MKAIYLTPLHMSVEHGTNTHTHTSNQKRECKNNPVVSECLKIYEQSREKNELIST